MTLQFFPALTLLLVADGQLILFLFLRNRLQGRRHAPRCGIVEIFVINLAQCLGEVTGILEVLGKRDYVGKSRTKMFDQVIDFRRIGTAPCQNTRSRRRAYCLLTVIASERNAFGSEPVYIRRDHVLTAETGKFRPQVVNADQQYVRALTSGSGRTLETRLNRSSPDCPQYVPDKITTLLHDQNSSFRAS